LRRLPLPKRDPRVWTLAEIRRVLLGADPPWRAVIGVAIFAGLRLGELQAMSRTGPNRPNFTFPEGDEAALKLHLSAAPRGASPCTEVHEANPLNPLENAPQVAACNLAQSDAWLGGQDSNLDSQIQSLMAYR